MQDVAYGYWLVVDKIVWLNAIPRSEGLDSVMRRLTRLDNSLVGYSWHIDYRCLTASRHIRLCLSWNTSTKASRTVSIRRILRSLESLLSSCCVYCHVSITSRRHEFPIPQFAATTGSHEEKGGRSCRLYAPGQYPVRLAQCLLTAIAV